MYDKLDWTQAVEVLRPHLAPTQLQPLEVNGRTVHLKMECDQPTRSFKIRPALYGILKNKSLAREKGILASSSGNFAQAVAYGASRLGLSAEIVMTSASSEFKRKRTEALGARVTLSGPSFHSRVQLTQQRSEQTGALVLHPFDSIETLMGDATLAWELLEQEKDPFTVLVPVSGGGLVASVARVLKEKRPECQVVGLQPKNNASLAKSLCAGKRVDVGSVSSLADALVASTPGELVFPLHQRYLDDVWLIEESEIEAAFQWFCAKTGSVAEPASALTLAPFLFPKAHWKVSRAKAICVVTGANYEARQAPVPISSFPSAESRLG